MRKPMFVVLCCLAWSSGCGSQSVLRTTWQEFLQIQSEVNDVLASIKDTASAEQARAKLKQLGERLQAAGTKMKSLGEPSAADKEWLEKEALPKLQANGQKMVQTLAAIQDPEVKKLAASVVLDFTSQSMKGVSFPGK